MKHLKAVVMSVSLLLLGTCFPPLSHADAWNKRTVVTFNEPLEIPGRVLSPGTYVFKLLDEPGNRHIVQIFNADESQIYATILAFPVYRLNTAGKTVITFEERTAGSPEAIQAWFYPGDNYGEEFVYPKAKAVEIAKATKQ